jgi:hypothetical protein
MDRRNFIAGTLLATAAGGVSTTFGEESVPGQAETQKAGSAASTQPQKEGAPGFSKIHTITLEEHYVGAPFIAGPGKDMLTSAVPALRAANAKLQDVGASRIAQMDEAGIDVQILSHSPGLEQLEAKEQVPMVRDTNDFLLETVAKYPARYGGFASLCTAAPDQAAKELERMMEAGCKGAIVNGHTRGRYLDDKFFWPILEVAQQLNAPIYLHPTQPPKAVLDTYYGGFNPATDWVFSTAGCGWHIETGIHVCRMVLGGVFDQFPNLKIIIGHMGEGLTFFMPRMEHMMRPSMTKLKKPIPDYMRENVYYTFSGFNFLPNFINLVSQVEVEERIMFATDYPFGSMMEARLFLESLPISPADKHRIAHGNAERLFKI